MNAVVSLLGSSAVSSAAAWLTRGRVRAVAYHDVQQPAAFAAQLDHFRARGYRTITGGQLADALAGVASLPERALWLTFDDGDASVAQVALPLLRERGMVATAFLCGAWIGTDEPPWWQVLEAAVAPSELVATRIALKRGPDQERRRRIEQMQQALAAAGPPSVGQQWSEGDVHEWLAAGNEVGNHSWDHPCLDRCDDEEQRRQVRLAHERLSRLIGAPVDTFAWPNGDASPAALAELQALGYRLVAGCDHRLVARRSDPMAVSRLRLDTSVGPNRTRAIISGAHSSLYQLQHLVRGGRPSSAVT
ncbi:MAG: polysaccharide deacetylase family protein [Actinomycetota bacterium]|nr:polysaccharide deacetylase family protein [Actinomycetota bacterium]